MANQIVSTTFAGLGTAASITAAATDFFFIQGKVTANTLTTAGVPNAVVVTINQNGTPIFSTTPGTRGFQSGVQATIGDLITVVVSSSLATDAAPLAVKSTISISEGL